MELLQFLTTFLTNEKNSQVLAPIIDLFVKNSFDIKKVLASLSPEMLKPIVENFMKDFSSQSSPSVTQAEGLLPISNIADKDIIFLLNKHFSNS